MAIVRVLTPQKLAVLQIRALGGLFSVELVVNHLPPHPWQEATWCIQMKESQCVWVGEGEKMAQNEAKEVVREHSCRAL